jgi:DNA-binding transcriptional LysR family regulator
MPTGQYYLAYMPDRASYPPLAAFRDWIAREIRSDMLAPAASIGQ